MAREMKKSGVDWIGDIPAEWKIGRTKNCYTNRKQIAGDEADNYERLALTLNGVIKRSKEDATGLQPEAFNGYQVLKQNQLVFKLIDLENVATSRVGYSPYTGIVSPAYIVLNPNKENESRYGEYFFLSMWQREVFNHMGDDGVRSSLNSSDLLNIPYLIIPDEEKNAIVGILDQICANINTVVEKTKATIEEYKKLKQSVITEAVTKGIRGDRAMKDSGIEWIVDIPADWEITRVKNVATKLQKGNGITKEDVVVNGDTPCVRYGEIYTKYNQSFAECVTRTNKDIIGTPKYFSYGDILFTCTGELVEEIGKSIVYLGSGECLAGGDIIIMNHKQNPAFLNYVLNSAYAQAQKSCDKTKLKVVHISADDICNVVIALPPIAEQETIADYLDRKCAEIDKLIADKTHLLEEMEIYKKSVIFEYVTGKKEVL